MTVCGRNNGGFLGEEWRFPRAGIVVSYQQDYSNKQIENQKKIYENQVSQYGKLVKSIKDNKNYFSASSAADSLYYDQYQAYKTQIKQQKVHVEELADMGIPMSR